MRGLPCFLCGCCVFAALCAAPLSSLPIVRTSVTHTPNRSPSVDSHEPRRAPHSPKRQSRDRSGRERSSASHRSARRPCPRHPHRPRHRRGFCLTRCFLHPNAAGRRDAAHPPRHKSTQRRHPWWLVWTRSIPGTTHRVRRNATPRYRNTHRLVARHRTLSRLSVTFRAREKRCRTHTAEKRSRHAPEGVNSSGASNPSSSARSIGVSPSLKRMSRPARSFGPRRTVSAMT